MTRAEAFRLARNEERPRGSRKQRRAAIRRRAQRIFKISRFWCVYYRVSTLPPVEAATGDLWLNPSQGMWVYQGSQWKPVEGV